ncbi:hypothetical protein [Mesorhizobium caraganae]|uniref:hypothetical protein n=1 Tax=Mesorhizobium caraganae TaxID=483206 RepID=UPI003ED0399B
MRRLETIQTKAMNSVACSVETSPEFMTASFVIGVPATVPMPPTTNAAMLILKSQDRVVDLMLIFASRRLFSLGMTVPLACNQIMPPGPRFVASRFRG